MKMVKTLSVVILGFATATVYAGGIQGNSGGVELISRYTGGSYTSATYSFWHKTRSSVHRTKNNWEILFEGRGDFEQDFFEVNIVNDDRSFIYDLGSACSKPRRITTRLKLMSWLFPPYMERARREVTMLQYGQRYGGRFSEAVPVLEGHCYVAWNNDSRGTIVTMFQVVEHIKNESVVIDNIRVLIKSNNFLGF